MKTSLSGTSYSAMKRALLAALFFFFACTVIVAEEKRYVVPIGDSPQLGPANAPVTIIEFLDFQ